ncbi:PTS sugar transporter subunit IIB [Streptococcus dysgalactiae]|uniref:PTS system mannose/fructose transporter subunit IIB n=2 Tax=Streptococcus dysgalactiae subsp. equisimilis TaxID=119602 RepID=A0AAE9U5N0_STREQ|nr:PTS sugar transporter subunit IIB [Streptococcus dysgalactiae]CRH91499.1 Fructose-specific phosphotransferase enzyme IIB component [Chlamydia trachomatis]KKC16227.1 PTS mannose transporter subunit IIAB [Streptococcus dysgalactiae subsp. equisimilis]MCY7209390.1 PTS sugar transporter subunit IIB [Streptococcus dysgalactiae]OBY96545.1 PTS mannose transporter subunit IIAB [Streptococcus dysgalactiae subsp. equisimilis]OCX02061.1 PTS mannose transporter subunit IIAB [Streptococcus dysgalactiae 
MTIVATRIDGRLIHGQVANLWTTKLNISRIMVVDEDIVNSDLEKAALKLATPAGIKLSVLTIDKAATNILAGRYDSQRLLIVAKRPKTFLGLMNKGVTLTELNVGNMSQTPETRSVTRSINVVDEDIQDFDAIQAKGTHLIAQMVPGDTPADFIPLLDKVR